VLKVSCSSPDRGGRFFICVHFQLDQHRTGDRLALLRSLFWQVTRPEQILARELRRCGPVIAIGRPDERLPELGAARIYASNDRWRDKIADVAHVSQLVVCATGTSEGLAWELSHMIATEPPEKLVLWAHPRLMGLDEAGREAEWTRFLASLGHLFPKPLPERLGETCFIHFGSTFAPIPVAPQVRWWRQRRTIRAVLTAKGLPKPDLVLRAYRHRLLATAGASAAAVLLAGSGILRLADRLEDRERNRFELRLRDSARERDGLDSLTEILVSNESAETPFRFAPTGGSACLKQKLPYYACSRTIRERGTSSLRRTATRACRSSRTLAFSTKWSSLQTHAMTHSSSCGST